MALSPPSSQFDLLKELFGFALLTEILWERLKELLEEAPEELVEEFLEELSGEPLKAALVEPPEELRGLHRKTCTWIWAFASGRIWGTSRRSSSAFLPGTRGSGSLSFPGACDGDMGSKTLSVGTFLNFRRESPK